MAVLPRTHRVAYVACNFIYVTGTILWRIFKFSAGYFNSSLRCLVHVLVIPLRSALLPKGLICSFHRRLDSLRHAFAFERATVTPYTFATVLAPAAFSYYVMAVLVQFPRTSLSRAALLPVVFWMTFRAGMSLDLSWNNPGYAHLNQALAVAMFTIAMRSTTWVLVQWPYTRVPICEPGNGTTNGPNENTPVKHDVAVPSAIWNAWNLIINLRGIGWNGPQKIHIPKPYFQVESRWMFSLRSLCQFIFLVLVQDVLCKTVRSFGPDTFGTPKGGTIFDPLLPPLERYMNSSAVTLLSGVVVYVILNAAYQLHAALFTTFFQQYPSQWPPLFDSPWLSTSLIDFWGRRWHQLFHEYFVVVGSKLAERYFGRVGFILGAFAISGILHDIGMRAMDRGADTLPMIGFFLIQGVGVIMERAWKRITGRHVGGVVGWLWVFTWLLLSGHLVMDIWARRGLLGSEFFPEAYAPTTLFLNWMFSKN